MTDVTTGGCTAGDVMVVTTSGGTYAATRSTVGQSPAVIGVCAPNAGTVLGMPVVAAPSGQSVVAFSGIVTVGVVVDAGDIFPGDLLVSSNTAGKAQKAGASPAPGTVIGKALTTNATGTVPVLLMLR